MGGLPCRDIPACFFLEPHTTCIAALHAASSFSISRFGFRVCDVAALIRKHGNSVTHWLNQGLGKEGSDADFTRRLDYLDAAISRRT